MNKLSPLYLAMFCSASLTLTTSAIAAGATSAVDEDIEVIEVVNLRTKLEQAGRLKDVIQQTEILDALVIEKKNALNLTAAINNEPGVNVSNECSMCGVKRVMLNGMKGEHTTILVDGLSNPYLNFGFLRC